jgi:hypothetical protein
MLERFRVSNGSDRLRILDPACGDGVLLEALLGALSARSRLVAQVVGFDTDERAVEATRSRLGSIFPGVELAIERGDFLDRALALRGRAGEASPALRDPFDLVIANPPYVRTQVMGAERAQEIARAFGFTGRVDLYFPFLVCISEVLAPRGVAGIIVSNRFMTTRSGGAVRREVLARFALRQVWDLGDTELFDAAVLPALLLAGGTGEDAPALTAFSSIYRSASLPDARAQDALAALDHPSGTVVGADDGRRFRVVHGTLDNGGALEGVWRLATRSADDWLARVEAHTWKTFSALGRVHVGVKTTADPVFIRSDWHEMPRGERPELLRPLTSRHRARCFKPRAADEPRMILYPHEATASGRAPADLARHPRTAAYLEKHRARLEARTYVIDAGRRWYEIWVPHDPGAWSQQKLVFLDIAQKPTFWIDLEGTVVGGECYWLRCEKRVDADLLWLALAVANSSFIEAFYDQRFHNKLYSGRRRFIAQYVEHFPLPRPDARSSRDLIAKAKEIYAGTPSAQAEAAARALDARVWEAFGFPGEVLPGGSRRARPPATAADHSGGSS